MKKKQPRKPRKAVKPGTTVTPLPESPKETGYNGWTNYETWMTNIWITSEQASLDYWQQQAREATEFTMDTPPDSTFTPAERATLLLMDELRAEHEQALPELTGFAADLLNGAMSDVNWYEIAKHLVEGVEQ